jgi:hypothetical protein
MALDHSCQVQRHSHAERGVDCYSTPAVAVTALLKVEKLPHRVWEPCAGKGHIVDVLRAHGHEVIGSDLIDYGRPDFFSGRDFLLERKPQDGCGGIVTNPPFKIAAQFVEHALRLSPFVVMLLRLAFMESERRCPILEGAGLARIHVFRKRLPMMHRDQWAGRKANSGMAFAWFVWERGYTGRASIDRISWERT